MGLDQYAGWLIVKPKNEDEKVIDINTYEADKEDPYWDCEQEMVFEWRKHARLQEYMRQLWHHRLNAKAPYGVMEDDFNCQKLFLDWEDIDILQRTIQAEKLPVCNDGFFWGQQFQEESVKDYYEQDFEFTQKAFEWLKEDKKVWYECWW